VGKEAASISKGAGEGESTLPTAEGRAEWGKKTDMCGREGGWRGLGRCPYRTRISIAERSAGVKGKKAGLPRKTLKKSSAKAAVTGNKVAEKNPVGKVKSALQKHSLLNAKWLRDGGGIISPLLGEETATGSKFLVSTEGGGCPLLTLSASDWSGGVPLS